MMWPPRKRRRPAALRASGWRAPCGTVVDNTIIGYDAAQAHAPGSKCKSILGAIGPSGPCGGGGGCRRPRLRRRRCAARALGTSADAAAARHTAALGQPSRAIAGVRPPAILACGAAERLARTSSERAWAAPALRGQRVHELRRQACLVPTGSNQLAQRNVACCAARKERKEKLPLPLGVQAADGLRHRHGTQTKRGHTRGGDVEQREPREPQCLRIGRTVSGEWLHEAATWLHWMGRCEGCRRYEYATACGPMG